MRGVFAFRGFQQLQKIQNVQQIFECFQQLKIRRVELVLLSYEPTQQEVDDLRVVCNYVCFSSKQVNKLKYLNVIYQITTNLVLVNTTLTQPLEQQQQEIQIEIEEKQEEVAEEEREEMKKFVLDQQKFQMDVGFKIQDLKLHF